MKTCNVIGAGRVGRTLAALWASQRTFEIQDVLDRTIEGARSAVGFVGQGTPLERPQDLRAADVWMLSTHDGGIAQACGELARSGVLRVGDIVFHCSGSLGADQLDPAAQMGALTASVHPLKTFADPGVARSTFAGTYCTAEGDEAALDVLTPAFEDIGARMAKIDPQHKTLYHAASVIVCNYLTALLETGLRCYEHAGLPRATAAAMIEPIVRDTVQNVFDLGTAGALTGPIARGDKSVVMRHVQALTQWQPHVAEIYRELGAVAVQLAREQSAAPSAALDRIEVLLKG
jgi:predicted short-subunit dehydrogenase-like oxidoreductase (DUF2520 family)